MVRESPVVTISITIRSTIARRAAFSLSEMRSRAIRPQKIFPGEGFQGARQQPDRKINVVIGKQGAQRPPNLSRDQRPAHRCRPAPFWVATLSAPAKYARPNPNPFSPFALTIAKHPGVAFGRLYSMRIAPLRTRSGFVHAGHDPQWRGGPFESRMLWAIVRNGQYVKCSRD